MKTKLAATVFFGLLLVASPCFGETIKLKATADIWLSDANEEERNSSAGKVDRFKLKSIQEMAAVRFDTSPIKGMEVISARLYLHTIQKKASLRLTLAQLLISAQGLSAVSVAGYFAGKGQKG